jgi:hypothetical protein
VPIRRQHYDVGQRMKEVSRLSAACRSDVARQLPGGREDGATARKSIGLDLHLTGCIRQVPPDPTGWRNGQPVDGSR